MAAPTMAPQWWVIPTMAPTKAPTAIIAHSPLVTGESVLLPLRC
jgi:hypothetical protein